MSSATDQSNETNLTRTKNLFEFLRQSQVLQSRPVTSLGSYEKIVWLADVTPHEATHTALDQAELTQESPVITVERLESCPPPVLPTQLHNLVIKPLDDCTKTPTLQAEWKEHFRINDEPEHDRPNEGNYLSHQNTDDIQEKRPTYDEDQISKIIVAFEEWLVEWQEWALQEKPRQEVRELYKELFQLLNLSKDQQETFELIFASGCLTWDNETPIFRHVFTVPATLNLNEKSGRITASLAPTKSMLNLELEMVDPSLLPAANFLAPIRAAVAEFEGHAADQPKVEELARRLVNTINADGQYTDSLHASPAKKFPQIAFAPALILRKRTQSGLVEIYSQILDQLEDAEEVPAGLLPLIDPNFAPPTERDSTPGAIVEVDDEVFLPLPVNEKQMQILKSVDSKAQTVVQGPPGTGKTHTAAALLSHLLAQGKRVLVTAHTDRALQEVRQKLPESIRPLSVAIVGAAQSDMSDLKVAVETIAREAEDFNERENAQQLEVLLGEIEKLREMRAGAYNQLLHIRASETTEQEYSGSTGTLAELATEYQANSERFGWTAQYLDESAATLAPVTSNELTSALSVLRDNSIQNDERDASSFLIGTEQLPSPEEFSRLVSGFHAADGESRQFADLEQSTILTSIQELTPDHRERVTTLMRSLATQITEIEVRPEPWVTDALADIRAGCSSAWEMRSQTIDSLMGRCAPLATSLGALTKVSDDPATRPALVAIAKNLLVKLSDGTLIKTLPNGTPKIGVFASKEIKQSTDLFDSVRVNGLPPTNIESVTKYIEHCEAAALLEALDASWPEGTEISTEDTIGERLGWHHTEWEQLQRVLALGVAIQNAEKQLKELGIVAPNWSDLNDLAAYARSVAAANALDSKTQNANPLQELDSRIRTELSSTSSGQVMQELQWAVGNLDTLKYREAYDRIARLEWVRSQLSQTQSTFERLSSVSPSLAEDLRSSYEDSVWDSRLETFESAWRWHTLGVWILQQKSEDVNTLQAHITTYEVQIRGKVEKLAATRAWSHAVSPRRISGEAQSDLRAYARLVKRLGKGTGKYALSQKAEIRQTLERCSTAVPVWIMPIYRIAEQFRIKENMFDVVLVDEASQAGAEAAFLQYLAPKIVVIGDNKQVSPSAVGVDQQQLRDLGNRFLTNYRHKASLQDPKISFFDIAMMLYSGRITLVEHRRCVPEIIGFSNEIAYEPDGNRLLAVRQTGADRLPPVVPVFIENGSSTGSSAKINRAEALAVVDQIEQCIADPRYEGLSMGVISLLGSAQARLIESMLIDRIPAEEWAARDLRCGDSPDFQGSERDVMFLSMVAGPPDPGTRLSALTQEMYVQRYNVAASRAKDQMWVYHSIPLSILGNREDMRFRLLEYCYRVDERTSSEDPSILQNLVSESQPEAPFDSLFEQRVFNRIYSRGYSVSPQVESLGYRIDLVVTGAQGKLAIECDGDHWHGPDAYLDDLNRQRELERCGWKFYRIRESEFYVDPETVLNGLWQKLDDLEIRPRGWVPPTKPMEETQTAETQADDDDTALLAVTPDSMDLDLSELNLALAEINFLDSSTLNTSESTDSSYTQVIEESVDTPLIDAPGTPAHPLNSTAHSEIPTTTVVTESQIKRIEEYHEFAGSADPINLATKNDIVETLIDIVLSEGPIQEKHLMNTYVKASGGSRLGSQIVSELEARIRQAVREGSLIEDSFAEGKFKSRVYRTTEQPAVRLRTLGSRTFDLVPLNELAAHIRFARSQAPWSDTEEVFRIALRNLGLRRLTANVQGRMELAWMLFNVQAGSENLE